MSSPWLIPQPVQGRTQWGRSGAVPVKDLGKGNPVQADDGAEAGKHVSRQCKHWLVDGCEESPKDDHACWRQEVCKRSTERLGRIGKKLGHGLKVANLQETSRMIQQQHLLSFECGCAVMTCKAPAALSGTAFCLVLGDQISSEQKKKSCCTYFCVAQLQLLREIEGQVCIMNQRCHRAQCLCSAKS